jgi:hypothetical protein
VPNVTVELFGIPLKVPVIASVPSLRRLKYRFAVSPGKPLDVPVKVNCKNGFAKPVEVLAEGLPEGVKFEVKPLAGKADPNVVVVTLSAEKPMAGGGLRLVGRVASEPALTRSARAPLAEFEGTTPELWVTVTNAAPAAAKPGKK